MSFHLLSSIHERYLSALLVDIFSRCFPSVVFMFWVLFSVVHMDVIVMLLSLLLYAPLVCILPPCWISGVCVTYYYEVNSFFYETTCAVHRKTTYYII
jgi:hypothetical protein